MIETQSDGGITRSPTPVDPPFEDELAAEVWLLAVKGQLTLDLDPVSTTSDGPPGPGVSWPPEIPPYPPTPPSRPAESPSPGTDPLTPSASDRPAGVASTDARHAARRFVDMCLEILNGYRPANHLRPLSRPFDAHTLIEEMADAAIRLRKRLPPGRHQPGMVKLRVLRVSEPRAGVAEAAVALGTDARTWAMAFRLERQADHWLGTALRVL